MAAKGRLGQLVNFPRERVEYERRMLRAEPAGVVRLYGRIPAGPCHGQLYMPLSTRVILEAAWKRQYNHE